MAHVRRADHDQTVEQLGIALGERQPHHPAVRRADDRVKTSHLEAVEKRGNSVRLIVRRDYSARTSVDRATAVEEFHAQGSKMIRIDGASGAHDILPPPRLPITLGRRNMTGR